MFLSLTSRAAAEYDCLRYGAMTPKMAAEYLRDGCIELRTFPETLRELYPGPDLPARLTARLQACAPDAAPASVTRKVNNWLEGKNQPTRREDVFQVAFALGLTESQTSLLLGQCTDYSLHYRDPRDMVYAWFLRSGGSYEEARAFFRSLPPAPRLAEYPADDGGHITRELQATFHAVHTQEALRQAFLANLDRFGQLHVRAYRYFDKYMTLLIRPAPGWDGVREEDYSIEKVMRKYLQLHMPSGRSRAGYTVVQKLVKQNWPNATALKNIRAHRADVPRKLLLLLYMITDNGTDGSAGYRELDEVYASPEERLDDHWWVLNGILTDCGMPLLDPRSATDWLLLYALTATGEESMSDRMTQVIDHLFADLQKRDEDDSQKP